MSGYPFLNVFDFYVLLFVLVVFLLIQEHYELLQQEASAFTKDYKDSGFAWISSVAGSIIAVTVGRQAGLWATVLVAGAFFIPATVHILRNYPFSLFCDYISFNEDTGKKDLGESEQKVCKPDKRGYYQIDLEIRTGAAIDTYAISVELPEGVEIDNFDSPPGDHELTEDNVIKGKALMTRPKFQAGLILTPASSLKPSSENVVVLADKTSERTLETVTLVLDP